MQSQSRRKFLARAACLAAAGAVAPLVPGVQAATIRPLVGTQLYGWGQYYGREGRNLDDHISEALGLVRDCGFDYAEGPLDVATPENNERFAKQLKTRGLRPVSLYTGGAFHVLGRATQTAERIAVAAKTAQKAGFQVIVCNPDPIGRDKTEKELEIQADALAELGADLKKLGMRLGVHHHTPEMRNGAKEFHSNFARTKAGEVDFCYDVHWVYRGGVAPAACLAQYGERVVSWHLRQSREQIWWEDLDAGDIDYGAIADFARVHHLPGRYTVELALENGTKITRGVVENHKRSREYVRRVFGA